MANDADKTEQATPKRKEESRKKGQVSKSEDLNRAFQLLVVLTVLNMIGASLYSDFGGILREYLGDHLNMEITDETVLLTVKNTFLAAMAMVGPIFVVLVICMVAINVAQVGLVVSWETMAFNPGKLSPIKGIKRIFSMRVAMKLLWSVLKVAVLSTVVYLSIKDRFTEIAGLGGCALHDILAYCFSLLLLILFRVCVVLIILALFDYIYQRFQYEKDLKMTKTEVKDEMKQALGDPQIKNRIRQAQLKLLKQRMMDEVPEATVVVTNPTTYAVAIKYDRGDMEVPMVVAKGMNLMAERIKKLAREHRVPVMENRLLAQSLYRSVEVGDPIPQRFFQAVAEVLTYIYKMKGGNRVNV